MPVRSRSEDQERCDSGGDSTVTRGSASSGNDIDCLPSTGRYSAQLKLYYTFFLKRHPKATTSMFVDGW